MSEKTKENIGIIIWFACFLLLGFYVGLRVGEKHGQRKALNNEWVYKYSEKSDYTLIQIKK